MKNKIPNFIKKEFFLKNFSKDKVKPLVLFLFLLGFAFLLLIYWFFWILSGEALLVLIPVLLLNIFYFFVIYNYINELESERKIKQNFKFNKNKIDENTKGILWQLEKRIGFSSIFVYVYSGGEIAFLMRSICNSLNLKAIYLSKDSLFIKKYFGKDLQLALGTFYVADRKDLGGMVFEIVINSIKNHSKLYTFINPNTNIPTLQALLKPYIVNYLINASETEYKLFKIFAKTSYDYNLNFEEIDKLRKQKNDIIEDKIRKMN